MKKLCAFTFLFFIGILVFGQKDTVGHRKYLSINTVELVAMDLRGSFEQNFNKWSSYKIDFGYRIPLIYYNTWERLGKFPYVYYGYNLALGLNLFLPHKNLNSQNYLSFRTYHSSQFRNNLINVNESHEMYFYDLVDVKKYVQKFDLIFGHREALRLVKNSNKAIFYEWFIGLGVSYLTVNSYVKGSAIGQHKIPLRSGYIKFTPSNYSYKESKRSLDICFGIKNGITWTKRKKIKKKLPAAN